MNRAASAMSGLLAACCLAGFAAIALAVRENGALVRFDREQAERFHQFASRSPAVLEFFRRVTGLGAGLPLTIFAIPVVMWVALQRRYRLALLCAVVMLLNAWSIDLLKNLFGRDRPPFVVALMNPSFPSGHMQGSTVVYGLTIYLIMLRWPTSRFRWWAAGALATLILLIGLSRMMLGVHYFSDVFAGMLMGMAWVGLTMAVVERFRTDLDATAKRREPG